MAILLGCTKQNRAAFESTIGRVVDIVQIYCQNDTPPTGEWATVTSLASAGYKVAVTYNSPFTLAQIISGSEDSRTNAIAAFLEALPTDGYVGFMHESEDGGFVAADFRAAASRVYGLLNAGLSVGWKTMYVYVGGFRNNGTTNNQFTLGPPSNWWPTPNQPDLIGVDYYNWRGASNVVGDRYADPTVADRDVADIVATTTGGVDHGIDSWMEFANSLSPVPKLCFPEFASSVEDDPGGPALRAAWIQTFADAYAGDSRIEFVNYFDLDELTAPPRVNWRISGGQEAAEPASGAAFANIGEALATGIGTPTPVSGLDTGSNASAYATTTAYTPVGGKLYVAWVGNNGSPSLAPTSFTGNSLTWTQIATVQNSNTTRCLTAFAADGGGGTSGVSTANFASNQSACTIEVLEITGVDTSTVATSPGAGKTIVQAPTGNGNAASASVTLATVGDTRNRNLSGFKVASTATVTPRSGWNELSEQAANSTMETQWRSTGFEPLSTATWSGSVRWNGIALELKAALLGWGAESWGDFRWGEGASSPQDVAMTGIINNAAVALTPLISRAQNITGMGLIDNAAQAFAPSTFTQGDRGPESTVNLRRGVRHGVVRGRGTFRSSSRVRGQDGGSTVRGNYRVRGGPFPSRSALQVTLGLIDNSAVALTPAIGSVQMPLVDNSAVALEPAMEQNRSVQLGFINNAAVAFEPSMGQVELPLIDNSAVALAPYIPIELGLIDNSAVALTPVGFTNSGQPGQSITDMVLVDNAAVALEPESITRGAPQQINTPLIDNMAQAIQMFIKQEFLDAIRLKGSYDDVIRLKGSYDDIITKKVTAMGTKAPIVKLDDWFQDEDQTFIWELPDDLNVTGWATRFKLATGPGGTEVLGYDGTVISSTELKVFSPAVDSSPLPAEQYYYEIARIDAGHHQVIAWGPAWLKPRIV